ncbi:hypothetical protein Tco_1218728 [Tanacetum coccineum]
MVKSNTNLQTQSSNALHNAIMEAGSKDRPPKLAPERAERLARTANPLALVAQQQPVYHHQNHPTQNTQYSSTRSQQSTRNRGKAIVTSSAPTYDPDPHENLKLPTTTFELHQTPVELIKIILQESTEELGMIIRGQLMHVSRKCQKPKRVKEQLITGKTCYCVKQEEAGVQLNAEQADWKDDIDDESKEQELEAHYMYMAQL